MLPATLGSGTIVQPLSIALVTDWTPPRVGGVERHVAGLARALARRGHRVHLFTTTRDPSAIDGVILHPIASTMFGDVAAPALWRVGELRAMLADAGVALVHAHGMFSTLAIGSLLAARGARIPSITTHHSLLRASPTLPAAWIAYRLFSHRATIVTAVSRAAAEDARRVSGRDDVAILPNGIDLETWSTVRNTLPTTEDTGFTADPSGFSSGLTLRVPCGGEVQSRTRSTLPVRVVSVMRLTRKKSPVDLIDAVPAVLARVGQDVVFTIVGDGPERAALERRARRLGIAAQVEFRGACAPACVAAILRQSDVFALPGRREAFGIAVLEARAAGLPIVAFASGGIPEIVEHGRHGLLAHTLPEFVDALARLACDGALRRRLAAAAITGLEGYDWDRVVDRHDVVYRRALNSRA